VRVFSLRRSPKGINHHSNRVPLARAYNAFNGISPNHRYGCTPGIGGTGSGTHLKVTSLALRVMRGSTGHFTIVITFWIFFLS